LILLTKTINKMALTPQVLKTTDDATTLVYNALGLVPAEQFDEAKAEVIAKLTALQVSGAKPTPIAVVTAFVDTLDDVAHDTTDVKFQSIMDVIDKIVNEVADGTFNIFKGIVDAVKLKKASK
jgi:hypothetical protein